MNTKLIYITAPNRAEAEKIAETVVTEKLAACANIIDGVTSIYHWKNQLCKNEETAVILKASAAQTDRLITRIKAIHSYECPCIIALPIENGNPDFLKWICENTESAT